MPRAKNDAKPRGRMTAYAFFVQTCREEERRRNPNGSVSFGDFSRKCAEEWKTASEHEKERFKEMADRDKKRYEVEMEDYVPLKTDKGQGKRRKRAKKDPNAPKRSLSAFFWFCNDERPKVRGLNPEYGIGEIAKELGRMWSEAIPEVKKNYYKTMAEQDKARYQKEMAAYRERGNSHAAAPAQSSDGDDDDEDEDEDE